MNSSHASTHIAHITYGSECSCVCVGGQRPYSLQLAAALSMATQRSVQCKHTHTRTHEPTHARTWCTRHGASAEAERTSTDSVATRHQRREHGDFVAPSPSLSASARGNEIKQQTLVYSPYVSMGVSMCECARVCL